MGSSHRNMAAIVALVTSLTCLGFLWKQSVGAEPPRIIDGSNVTFLYQITVPGEGGLELRDLGQGQVAGQIAGAAHEARWYSG